MAVGQQGTAVGVAMAENDLGETGALLVRQEIPELTGQGVVGDDGTVSLAQQLGDEVTVHRSPATMGVEVAFSQFHGLAQHDAESDIK